MQFERKKQTFPECKRHPGCFFSQQVNVYVLGKTFLLLARELCINAPAIGTGGRCRAGAVCGRGRGEERRAQAPGRVAVTSESKPEC